MGTNQKTAPIPPHPQASLAWVLWLCSPPSTQPPPRDENITTHTAQISVSLRESSVPESHFKEK